MISPIKILWYNRDKSFRYPNFKLVTKNTTLKEVAANFITKKNNKTILKKFLEKY